LNVRSPHARICGPVSAEACGSPVKVPQVNAATAAVTRPLRLNGVFFDVFVVYVIRVLP
jgi:hypothetical protein